MKILCSEKKIIRIKLNYCKFDAQISIKQLRSIKREKRSSNESSLVGIFFSMISQFFHHILIYRAASVYFKVILFKM